MWGIWATCSGGMTGRRANWVRGEQHETQEAAEEAARGLTARLTPTSRTGGMSPSGRPIARITYTARQVP